LPAETPPSAAISVLTVYVYTQFFMGCQLAP
jgi:hypothetical protein